MGTWKTDEGGFMRITVKAIVEQATNNGNQTYEADVTLVEIDGHLTVEHVALADKDRQRLTERWLNS
jgi:hypothetical protein